MKKLSNCNAGRWSAPPSTRSGRAPPTVPQAVSFVSQVLKRYNKIARPGIIATIVLTLVTPLAESPRHLRAIAWK
jgi:hypothetical protein